MNNKKIEIASLTDHLYTPSSRFRVRQYLNNLSDKNIEVTDFPRYLSSELSGKIFKRSRISNNPIKLLLAGGLEFANFFETLLRVYKSRDFDATWISRELLIGYPSFEGLMRKPYFYDIDDALFLRNNIQRYGIDKLISNSSANFCGNSYIADYCSRLSSNVFVIPTAVDTEKFHPIKARQKNKKLTFGWSGTSSSFKFFIPLEDDLFKFFNSNKDVKLKIISDRFPYELKRLAELITFEPWASSREVEQINSFDVGLMPLEDSEWVRGKCSYKMLLYAACGVPTIASNYGMNKEVLDKGNVGIGCKNSNDWLEALEYFYKSQDSFPDKFHNCRELILSDYSKQMVANKIEKIIRMHC
jgi:glycosyltransferase involved in cell wall biosynthesis